MTRPVSASAPGTPNSLQLYGPNARGAAESGLRLISSCDRPGYGESSTQPIRTVADCAADVRVICADLRIDRLATWASLAAARTCWLMRCVLMCTSSVRRLGTVRRPQLNVVARTHRTLIWERAAPASR